MTDYKAPLQLFTRHLMHWHQHHNDRSLPWKKEQDPYRIWLSEIILQQTRAAQGLPYYLRFTEGYPTITHLAAAPDEEVFRLWQGLGYYNRCKNMLVTARYIVQELRGIFPSTYDDILTLKGIGAYTAAAISSFAYGLPCAVVDGNVYRVLSRYFGIATPIDSTAGKKEFQELSTTLLDKEHSAAYNQAIMDAGATICTPAAPLCDSCPLQSNCYAYKNGTIQDYPVKGKKLTVKKRYFHYIWLHTEDDIFVHQRTAKDIWQNLYEPFLIEADTVLDITQLKKDITHTLPKIPIDNMEYMGTLSQRLTHRIIESHFYNIKLTKPIANNSESGIWMKKTDLKNIAFPRTIVSFLENNLYF